MGPIIEATNAVLAETRPISEPNSIDALLPAL
jgi:hypothetical protein